MTTEHQSTAPVEAQQGSAKASTDQASASKPAATVETKTVETQTTEPSAVTPKTATQAKSTKSGTPAKSTRKKAATRAPSAPRPITGANTMTTSTAAKKETVKDTIQTVTHAQNEALKEGFDKSLNAMNEINAFQKDTVDAVIASATSAGKSIEELNANVLGYAKKAMEDGVSAAKNMASAKSVQELVEIHADYTKSALDAYLAEVNKTSDLMSGMFKETFKPLNDRISSAIEMMQSQR
ncbi:phasin family protein [Woodsholea maritima]|uniref:phasin family protein n=1 Tax=Woodsholea maritima TaxID=240237 RepID=UPI0014616BB8|nr:TIGR01841 family phasin [Woodsholea maritima]